MARFVKNPVEVEAVQLTFANRFTLLELLRSHKVFAVLEEDGILISTLEGDMLCGYGDWLIMGVEGEFYPCKNGIFNKTYSPVRESDNE